jgi:hypothetical protein
MAPVIYPTCQTVFAGCRIDHSATLHGVVFDILVGRERLSGDDRLA